MNKIEINEAIKQIKNNGGVILKNNTMSCIDLDNDSLYDIHVYHIKSKDFKTTINTDKSLKYFYEADINQLIKNIGEFKKCMPINILN